MRKEVALVVIAVLTGCGEEKSSGPSPSPQAPLKAELSPGGTPTSIRSEYDERKLAFRALEGDSGAAWELAIYYGDSDKPENVRKASLWSRVAVENRSPEAMLTIGYSLASSEDQCSIRRGIYLMESGLSGVSADRAASWRIEISHARDRLSAESQIDCTAADLLN